MAVEDIQIWADHLETIRLPEIEADIADIQPRLSQAEADIVSKVQTINDTLTLHSARIDEAQVDADAAMDRANYALTRVYDQFIEANSNWMMALDALRDEFTYDLNSSTAAITDAYTNAILAQLSAATLKVQTEFDVKVAEVEGIKTTIDGIKANIDLDIDTLNNTILPGMNAEIDQLQLDTGTIAGDLTTLQSDLQTFYYSATDTETAIAGAITTAKSEIENPNGASLGATLAQSYRTSADQDAVTAAALLTFKSEIEDADGTSLGATLSNDYLTTSNTNSAIAAAINTLKSEIENPNGDSIAATLDQNYLTSAETNSAIASADQTLKSQIESPTGTIRSFLTSQYLTSSDTNTAIAGAVSTLKSQIEDENGTSLGATLSQNYYTSADTNSAIATEINTYDASVTGGLAANVTTQKAALSNLEDNAAASYVMRAKAGGAVGEVEIVAADSVIGGPVSTVRLSADDILLDGTVRITDSSGNVLLASGVPLDFANVGGSTKPANNADKTSLNTAMAIANQGIFATAPKLTNNNIGTYISNLAVGTLQIAGNAVTIPKSETLTTSVSGTGSTTHVKVQELDITLEQDGHITVIFTAKHGYAGTWSITSELHQFEIRLNGTTVIARGGIIAVDYPSISWADDVNAGTHTVAVYWRGTTNMTLHTRTLTILGSMR